MNAIDTIINFVSPAWALKREKARVSLGLLRKYEAASTSDRTKGWTTPSTSADTEIAPALLKLIWRSRDLIRNNPLALRGRKAIVSHLVGSGITTQAVGESKKARALNSLWKRWAEKKVCDRDGHSDIYGLQVLAANAVVESGSVLARRVWVSGKEIPIEIELIEPDHLDLSLTKHLPDGGYIKQGIEFSENKKRRAYWLFTEHPGEANIRLRELKSVRIPAEDIAHIFFKERPGQNLGVPWLASVAITLKDFADFEDAYLTRQKISACFAAFVRDMDVPEDVASGKVKLFDKISPGRVELLPAGKDIVFSNPPAMSGYGEFSKSQKQIIATGLGLTYESLTGDLSQVNFSSGRLGRLDMDRISDLAQWQMFIPLFCDRVFRWFEEACELSGLVSDEEVEVSHTPPKRDIVDIVGETQARKEMVRCGFKTPSEAIREHGYDPDTFYAEYAADLEKIDALGIVLDIDARQEQKIAAAKSGSNYTDIKKEKQEDEEKSDSAEPAS